jgi:MFS family permease
MCSATANPLLALRLTHSPILAGWVGAASTIPMLLMYLPAGWFVDRFNRRRLMFVSQSARLLVCAFLVCVLCFGDHRTSWLIVAALCEGAFLVIYTAAEITAVQRVVHSAALPSALAMNEARSHLTLMAGRPLGGFLFGANKALPYCMNVLASVWSIVALLMMDKKDYQPRNATSLPGTTADERSRISVFSGVRVVILSPFLRTVAVVCAIGNFFFQTVVLLLVVLAEQQHMSSASIGLLLATSGVGGLIGSIVAPRAVRWVRDERNIIKFCVAAWALLILIVAVSAQPVVGLIAWGGLSVTGGFLNIAISNFQANQVPEHLLGRVIGINRLITSGAAPLGALSAGYIVAELHPHRAAVLVFGVVASMTIAVPFLLRPRRRLTDKMVDKLKAWLAPPPFASSDLDVPAGARGTSRSETVAGLLTEGDGACSNPPATGHLTDSVHSSSATSPRSDIPRAGISSSTRSEQRSTVG